MQVLNWHQYPVLSLLVDRLAYQIDDALCAGNSFFLIARLPGVREGCVPILEPGITHLSLVGTGMEPGSSPFFISFARDSHQLSTKCQELAMPSWSIPLLVIPHFNNPHWNFSHLLHWPFFNFAHFSFKTTHCSSQPAVFSNNYGKPRSLSASRIPSPSREKCCRKTQFFNRDSDQIRQPAGPGCFSWDLNS